MDDGDSIDVLCDFLSALGGGQPGRGTGDHLSSFGFTLFRSSQLYSLSSDELHMQMLANFDRILFSIIYVNLVYSLLIAIYLSMYLLNLF